MAGFLSSDEYYNNSNKGQSNNHDWIQSATQDELGRPATTAERAATTPEFATYLAALQ